MARVVTDDVHYKNIAHAVREQLGGLAMEEHPMRSAELADGVRQAASRKEAVGYAKGVEEGEARCRMKHFVYPFVGDGSGTVSVNIPFAPDKVLIFNLNPLVQSRVNEVALFAADIRAFGRYAAFTSLGTGSSLGSATYTSASLMTRYSRQEDGLVTLCDLKISATATGVFTAGQSFVLVAVKDPEISDRERIIAFVNGLTGSGTATLNQAKINAALTDEEWSALIAAKPGWTFVFI